MHPVPSLSHSSRTHLKCPFEEHRITGPHSDLPYWVYQSFLWTSIFVIRKKRSEWVQNPALIVTTSPGGSAIKPWSSANGREAPAPTPTDEHAAGSFQEPSQGALTTQPLSGHSSGATVQQAAGGMRPPPAPASAGIMYAPHQAPVTQSQPVCAGRDSP